MKKHFVLALVLFCAVNGMTQDPSFWRGPSQNGNYPDKGLLKEWPEAGPELLWHFDEAGKGYSAPTVYNGRIYLTGTPEDTGYVFVLDLNGKLIKKYPYGKEFVESYPGSRTSPTLVGDLLYVSSSLGHLYCLKAESGEPVWHHDLLGGFDGPQIKWGLTETVLVDGDLVFCTPGGKKNNVMALNRFTGKVVWTSPGLGEESAYCSPLIVNLPSRKLLVTHTASHILGMDAGTGKVLWSHHQPNRYSVHANTPLYHDGSLFCFSGYGHGGVMLKLNEDGSSVTKEWFQQKYDSRMGGAVYHNGHIYGSGDNNRFWMCLDWKTGEVKWESTGLAVGVVILADGMLYGYSQRGELVLIKADPSSYQLKGNTKITLGSDQHWAHLVMHEGTLLVRHGQVLMAYKVK